MKTIPILSDSLVHAPDDPLFAHDHHADPDLHTELRELGLSAGELAEVEETLDRHVRDRALTLASEAFREVILQLAQTQHGAQLAAALGLAPASFADLAARWNCSKQSVQQGASRLHDALGRFTVKRPAPPKPKVEPPAPGFERKCSAVRRWAGAEAAIRAGRIEVVRHADRAWVDSAIVDKLKAEAELAAAEARLREAPALRVDASNVV